MLDRLVKHCATESVGGAKAQAKAHCHAIIETSLKLLQVDKELDISTEHDGISVTVSSSRQSGIFSGDVAAVLQHFSGSSVSECSFQSCISGDDEGDGDCVTRQKCYRKTRCSGYPSHRILSGYPAYRIRFSGMPWKGYDSLQTFEVEDLFTEQPRVKPTGTRTSTSSSDDGSDIVELKLYKKKPVYKKRS